MSEKKTFETNMNRLEKIVSELENGDIDTKTAYEVSVSVMGLEGDPNSDIQRLGFIRN